MKYIRTSLLIAFLTFSSIFAAQSSQDTEICSDQDEGETQKTAIS